ncbi:MAG: hypothetical protein OEV07_01105 [Gammaproteobacteria bacterium]|nr:hypothetical protein [Gammaproteobacteria bacterium]
MKIFNYIALSILGLSIAGFIWLGWFLVTTPASSFDTQGPGLLAAFVMFGSQVLALVGMGLLIVWKVISIWLSSRDNGEQLKP